MQDRAERIRELCARVTTTTDETILIELLHELKVAITEHTQAVRSRFAAEIRKIKVRTNESDLNLFL